MRHDRTPFGSKNVELIRGLGRAIRARRCAKSPGSRAECAWRIPGNAGLCILEIGTPKLKLLGKKERKKESERTNKQQEIEIKSARRRERKREREREKKNKTKDKERTKKERN